MKLVTDERCRLQSPELFKPNTSYDAEIEADGSVRLVELGAKSVPTTRLRRINGKLRWPEGVKPTRAQIAAAIRADRDSR